MRAPGSIARVPLATCFLDHGRPSTRTLQRRARDVFLLPRAASLRRHPALSTFRASALHRARFGPRSIRRAAESPALPEAHAYLEVRESGRESAPP